MATRPPEAMVKIKCDECGGGFRNHKVLAEVDFSGENEAAGFWWNGELQICQCSGCDEHRFRKVFRFSEDLDQDGQLESQVSVYPEVKPQARAPDSDLLRIPKVGTIYKETVTAMSSGMPTLCAGGLRAVVEAVCLEQNIPGKTLFEKIEAMASRNLLTKSQAEFLHEERFLGNAALHEIEIPSDRDLLLGLEITEALLRTIYVLPKKAAELKAARQRKEKNAKK